MNILKENLNLSWRWKRPGCSPGTSSLSLLTRRRRGGVLFEFWLVFCWWSWSGDEFHYNSWVENIMTGGLTFPSLLACRHYYCVINQNRTLLICIFRRQPEIHKTVSSLQDLNLIHVLYQTLRDKFRSYCLSSHLWGF